MYMYTRSETKKDFLMWNLQPRFLTCAGVRMHTMEGISIFCRAGIEPLCKAEHFEELIHL